MMTINALVSSDSVLIPVQAAYLPVKGLQPVSYTHLELNSIINEINTLKMYVYKEEEL